MSFRTKKVIYIIYLIALPVLLICIERIYKLADIYTSRTYTPVNDIAGFFLYIIAGVIIGADIFFVRNSGLAGTGCAFGRGAFNSTVCCFPVWHTLYSTGVFKHQVVFSSGGVPDNNSVQSACGCGAPYIIRAVLRFLLPSLTGKAFAVIINRS